MSVHRTRVLDLELGRHKVGVAVISSEVSGLLCHHQIGVGEGSVRETETKGKSGLDFVLVKVTVVDEYALLVIHLFESAGPSTTRQMFIYNGVTHGRVFGVRFVYDFSSVIFFLLCQSVDELSRGVYVAEKYVYNRVSRLLAGESSL